MDYLPQVRMHLPFLDKTLTRWLRRLGYSGYDFGYFLKILTATPLPFHEDDFHSILEIWFPSILDMKYIHRAIDKAFKGGLKDLADQLQVRFTSSTPLRRT